ncbi:MAG TPA: SemiSWEET transporter [Caulobacteraceae bacterium]|nr:SemiSWEET transporter [Caulobacteraceae bacterium]
MSDYGPFLMQAAGVGAAICSTTSFMPQLLKLVREKAAEAVSLGMYVLTVSAFTLWIVYGVSLHSWPLVASNAISLGLSSAILGLSWRYRDRSAAPASRGAATGPRRARDPA